MRFVTTQRRMMINVDEIYSIEWSRAHRADVATLRDGERHVLETDWDEELAQVTPNTDPDLVGIYFQAADWTADGIHVEQLPIIGWRHAQGVHPVTLDEIEAKIIYNTKTQWWCVPYDASSGSAESMLNYIYREVEEKAKKHLSIASSANPTDK